MKFLKILIAGSLAVLLLVVFVLAMYLIKGPQKSPLSSSQKTTTVSPDILFLTQPVTSFSGIVKEVKKNLVAVSQTITLQNTTALLQISPNQQPQSPITKQLEYKVKITDKTEITRPQAFIPYLFPQNTTQSPEKLNITDLKAGEQITVNSKVDLRTLTDNMFEANSVILPPINNTINGTIKDIKGKNLTVEATGAPGPGLESTKAKIYTVAVTEKTEISRMPPASPEKPEPAKPQRLSLADLKKGMPVTIYTDIDVAKTESFNALLINPQIIENGPPGQTQPSGTPSASTP